MKKKNTGDGTRTHTHKELDFESSASTNSATPAFAKCVANTLHRSKFVNSNVKKNEVDFYKRCTRLAMLTQPTKV